MNDNILYSRAYSKVDNIICGDCEAKTCHTCDGFVVVDEITKQIVDKTTNVMTDLLSKWEKETFA